ncbi:MAG TPA: AMP-binding protein [Solirubrobacteraceae bacterium]|nr:AMP-binding protein [Solirubrobacteraceae bacterium]
MPDYAWEPTPDYVERANVTRLMRAHSIDSIEELRERSVQDVAWYWDAVVKDLAIPFTQPYERVLDTSDGIAWARWFVGGRINLTSACVDRWLEDPQRADQPALIGEAEDGPVRTLSYRELAAEIDGVANALRAAGIGRGDAVGVFMPMVCEAVIAAYAIAKIGAIYLPIFSGFAPAAVASRLQDAEAKLVFTADGTWRRGRHGEMKPFCDEAVAQCPTVKRVVMLERLGIDVPMTAGRDRTWAEFVAGHDRSAAAEDTQSEDVFMLAYTSGTTGKPKGSVHVHGGFTVKIASEVAYSLDLHAGEVFYWVTDMGWIMGPLSMVGSHAVGGTMLMYEGAPDFPEPDRVWASVERHRVTMLGISPTLIRALKPKGDDWVGRHDRSSLRVIGSTGEPWNPEPYEWLAREAGEGRVPIINISGGTEVGACFLTPYPVEPIKECSLGGPSLGMDVDVFDAEGRSLRGEVGELVCKQPWPGMTRGVWGDRERYLSSYWSMYPGVWRHGDWAKVDEDGQWFLYGRSDEAINVAGKRLGPAEVESILVGHAAVAEAATVGVPDETKGEAVWCFWVAADPTDREDVSAELAELVAHELGRPFKPARVIRVEALPKTRSAKILRRAVRAAAIGEDPGDLSSAENPQAVSAIRAAVEAG